MLILFNKPFGVHTQFRAIDNATTLAAFIDIPNIYPAGRLDKDSEGLLLLTDDGQLSHRITAPKQNKWKRYWVQVDGIINDDAIAQLRRGVTLKDGPSLPAKAEAIEEPELWPRHPPVRVRKNIPTSWISIHLREGRNRQIRRMTAHVGFPTLRLIRHQIADYCLADLQPGCYRHFDKSSDG